MRLWLAIRCFFRVLTDREFAEVVRSPDLKLLAAPAPPATPPKEKPATAPPRPARSEAITLLAALQREARLVDLVSESLDDYSDAQVGAAARNVLRDCHKVLERMFALQPLAEEPEGSQIEVPADYDSSRYRLTGNLSQQPPCSGEVVHAGWKATQCELPTWSGSDDGALVVAPLEVQVK